MADDILRRILCVDDEQKVLDGLKRTLRRDFEMQTALKAPAGLVALRQEGPFAVVVSDLRMPGMDGVAFLRRVRKMCPDTVRVLLTGNADLEAAVEAVNQGAIFRFLNKPCPKDVLVPTLEAACEQYRLITSERVLLEQTLRGSVKALADALALANPAAFGRSSRIESYVRAMLDEMEPDEVPERWPIEVAAMLSQIGSVALPPGTVEKLEKGESLDPEETKMVAKVPEVTQQLLGNIPRLEVVREILGRQSEDYDADADDVAPLGSRILRVASDFCAELAGHGVVPAQVFERLSERKGRYERRLIKLLESVYEKISGQRIEKVKVRALRQGMIFNENVTSKSGQLIVSQGQEVTSGLLSRLMNFKRGVGVNEPIEVIVPDRVP